MAKKSGRPRGDGLARLAYALDAKPMVLGSRLRLGTLHARGVPAILLGVATIVLAAGTGSALLKSAALLPETLREARAFWLAVRGPRRELPG
jgi:hypothetical protein